MSSETTVYPVLSYVIVCEVALHNYNHPLTNKATQANTVNNNKSTGEQNANAKYNEDELSYQQESCDVISEQSLLAQLTPLYCASALYGHVNMYKDCTLKQANQYTHQAHEENENICECNDNKENETHMQCVIDENAALRGVLEGFAGSVLSLKEHDNTIIHNEQTQHWEHMYKEYATFTAQGEIKTERLLSPLAAEGVYIQVPSTEYIRRCHRQASNASSGQRKNNNYNNNTQQVITNPFQFANEFNEHHCSSHNSVVDDNTKDWSSNFAKEHTEISETSLNLPDLGYLYGYAFCPRGTQILCNKLNKNNNNDNNVASSTLMICILSHSPCFNFMRRCAMEAVNMIQEVYVLMCSDTLSSNYRESIVNSENNNNHKNSNNSCSISSSKRRSILANLIAEKLAFVESYVNVRSDVNTHTLPGQLLPMLQTEKIRETVPTLESTPSSTTTFAHAHVTINITQWCQVKQKLRKPLDVLYPYAEVPLPVLLSSFPFSAIRILQTLVFFSLDSSIYSSSNSKGNVSVNTSTKLFVIGTSAQHASACVIALPALLTPLSFCGTVMPFISPRAAVQSRFLEFVCYHDNNNSCLVGSTPELIPHLQLLSNLPCSYNRGSCEQHITKRSNISTSIWIADARTGFVGRVPFFPHTTNHEISSIESLSSKAISNTSAALAADTAILLQTCKLLPLVPYDGRLRRRIKRAINRKQHSTFRAAINLHTRQEERYDRFAQEIKEAACRNKDIKEFAYIGSPTLSSSHPSSYQEYHLHSHKYHRKQAKAAHVNTNIKHDLSEKYKLSGRHHHHHHHNKSKYDDDNDDDQLGNRMNTDSPSYSSSSSSSSTSVSSESHIPDSFSEDFISNSCNYSHTISSSASSSSSSSASFATSSDKESSSYDDKSLFTASVIDVIDMDEQETGQRSMPKIEALCLETQNKSGITGTHQIGVTSKMNNNTNMKTGSKTKCHNNHNNSSINNNVQEWSNSLYSYTGCYCLEYAHGALLAANTRWLLGNYRLPLMAAGMNVEKSLDEYICQHNILPLLRAMTNKNNVPATLLNVVGTSYAVFVFFQALAQAEKKKLSIFLQNVSFTSTGANMNTSNYNIYLSHPSFRSLLQLFFVHACRCFPSLFAEIAYINGILQCEQITRRVLALHEHLEKEHKHNTDNYRREKDNNSYSVQKFNTGNMRSTSTLMTLTLSAMALGKVKHNKKSMTTNNIMSGDDKQQVSISTTTTTTTADYHSNKLNKRSIADNYNYSVKDGKQKKKGVKGFFAAAKKMVKSTFATGKNGEGSTMYCNSKKNQKAYAAVIDNFLQLRTSSRTLPFVENYEKRQYTFDEEERKAELRLQCTKCNAITLADLIASSKQNTEVSYSPYIAVTSDKYKNSELQVNLLPLDVTYQFADYHPLLAPASTNAYNAEDKNEHWHEKPFLSLCFNLPHNANMWHRANDIFTSQIINATTKTTMTARTEDNTFSNDIDELNKRREHEERNVKNDEEWQDLTTFNKIGANDCNIDKTITITNINADVNIEEKNFEEANEKVTSKDNTNHAITLDDLFEPITKIDNTNAHITAENKIYNNNDHIEPSVFTSEVNNTHGSSPHIREHQTLVGSSPNNFANITNTQNEQFSTLTEWGNFTSGAPDEYVAETRPLMWSANTLTPICNNNENNSNKNNNFVSQDSQHLPATSSISFQSSPMIAPQSNQQKQDQEQSGATNGTSLLDELFGSTS